jgi:hypothetical protein
MAKQFEANDDWIKREGGRIPTKGAAAAERASAGLGTLTDDAALLLAALPPNAMRRIKGSAAKRSDAPRSTA